MALDTLDIKFSRLNKKLATALASKQAFAPTGSMPPPDPSMMAAMGAPAPADPAAMGGAPMDPAMAGGAPQMDPAMMGGDPAATGGGMPPMDPSMMGGAPMDPAAMGAPPVDPASMGAMPPEQQDPMQMIADLKDAVDKIGELLTKVCRKLDVSLEDDEKGAQALLNAEDQEAVAQTEQEQAQLADPLSGEAAEAVNDPKEMNYVQQQLQALGGGMA